MMQRTMTIALGAICLGSTVSSQVVADFSVDVVTGTTPLTVSFTDLSTSSPVAWVWEFGDGATSIDQHPVRGSDDLVLALERRREGEAVTVRFLRDGDEHTVEIRLGPPSH